MLRSHRGDVDRVAFIVKQISVDPAVDGTSVERHHILCQSAGLVREDVLDLSEFFIQRRCPRLRRSVGRSVVHLVVPVDPPAVSESNHLHADTCTHTAVSESNHLHADTCTHTAMSESNHLHDDTCTHTHTHKLHYPTPTLQ